jgi:hypothetical protein
MSGTLYFVDFVDDKRVEHLTAFAYVDRCGWTYVDYEGDGQVDRIVKEKPSDTNTCNSDHQSQEDIDCSIAAQNRPSQCQSADESLNFEIERGLSALELLADNVDDFKIVSVERAARDKFNIRLSLPLDDWDYRKVYGKRVETIEVDNYDLNTGRRFY